MPRKPSGKQKCRHCRERKVMADFPIGGTTCNQCREEIKVRKGFSGAAPDPFRYGIAVKELDQFLRRPLP